MKETIMKKMFTHLNIWMISKKFNAVSLAEKEDFCSYLNLEEVTDAF